MSDFKYQSYDSAKMDQIIGDRKLTEDLYLEYRAATEKPDLQDFINHQIEQCRGAADAGDSDMRWFDMVDAIKKAELAIHNGDPSGIAVAFFDMGRKAERLKHPSDDEISEFMQVRFEKSKRELPLKLKNSKIRFLKGCAEIIARRIWEKDAKQEIKLIDACEKVWPELIDVAEHYNVPRDYYPNDAAGLKPWLRPLAPEYARKGGRPKK